MKASLNLVFRIDTEDSKKERLSTDSSATAHRRKGSRRKQAKPPSPLRKLIQVVGWIPHDVLSTLFAAFFATVFKMNPK